MVWNIFIFFYYKFSYFIWENFFYWFAIFTRRLKIDLLSPCSLSHPLICPGSKKTENKITSVLSLNWNMFLGTQVHHLNPIRKKSNAYFGFKQFEINCWVKMLLFSLSVTRDRIRTLVEMIVIYIFFWIIFLSVPVTWYISEWYPKDVCYLLFYQSVLLICHFIINNDFFFKYVWCLWDNCLSYLFLLRWFKFDLPHNVSTALHAIY